MNTVGFKGFRKAEEITDEALNVALSRLSTSNLYVFWTGDTYKLRSASLRSNSLRTITEVKTPVPVEELIRRAARISGNQGYNPATVKSGLYLHRNSKPAVYFALERKEDGSFVAAADTPYALGFQNGLKRGDIVIPSDDKHAREITRAIAAAKKALPKVEQAAIAAPKTEQPKLTTVVKKGKKALAAANA
jgi:hypothetical protein